MGVMDVTERVYGVVAILFMLKALFARIWICGDSFWRSRDTVMAANSALLIVCLSGCVLISIWVVVCLCGFTMDDPNAGFPDFCHPFVYMKPSGFHYAWNGLIEIFWGWCLGLCMYG